MESKTCVSHPEWNGNNNNNIIAYAEFLPSPELQCFISNIRCIHINNPPNQLYKLTGYQNGNSELFFLYSGSFFRQGVDDNRIIPFPAQEFVVGPGIKTSWLLMLGDVQMINISIMPGCAHFFVHDHLSYDPLGSTEPAANFLSPSELQLIRDTIPTSWMERYKIIEQILLQKIRTAKALPSMVGRGLQLFQQGLVSRVNKLTKRLDVSERTLERLFKKWVGLNPVEFHRVHRFGKIVEFIETHHHYTNAMVAQELGFYDEAHMVHELQKLTGFTAKQVFSSLLEHQQIIEEIIS